jgi:hypothetical protein
MTPQEQQLLQGLTDRVNQTQLTDKDPDAEQFIFQNLGKNSDSLYILAQTVLVQQYALDSATKQLADLKQQLTDRNQQLEQLQQAQQQPVRHTSFLGSLLGTDTPPPPPPPQYAPVQTYAPPPPYAQQYAQPVTYGYGAPPYGSQSGGGFLRSAMRTATGVAAGALAFEGIESLMHGFGAHAGYGSGYGSGFDNYGGGGRPEEIINNNYYGDAAPGSEHHSGDLTDRFADAGDQPSSDIEDRRDDTFADTSNNDDLGADDTAQFDDSSDNFSDDSSSFDDSGS